MGVYLGDNGHIELKRDQTDPTAAITLRCHHTRRCQRGASQLLC